MCAQPPNCPPSYYPQPFAFRTLLPSNPLPPPSAAAAALPRRAHSIVRFVAHCRLIYHLALQAFSECNELLTSNCHAHNITPASPRAPHPSRCASTTPANALVFAHPISFCNFLRNAFISAMQIFCHCLVHYTSIKRRTTCT